MSKFQLYCTCTVCKSKISTQNLNAHFKSKHTIKSYCLQCNAPIYNKDKKFCNTSCAAKYTSSRKDYSNIKSGPKKGFKPLYTKVKQCVICNKFHARYGQTCSDKCYKELLSNKLKLSIANGYNPNLNRGRGKRSFLEQSFDNWLQLNNVLHYHTEYPFKRFDYTKTYFADFYFPDKNLIIELDGTQHKNTVDYDTNRDEYISLHYNVQILRISHKEYVNKVKLLLIMSLLNIN